MFTIEHCRVGGQSDIGVWCLQRGKEDWDLEEGWGDVVVNLDPVFTGVEGKIFDDGPAELLRSHGDVDGQVAL